MPDITPEIPELLNDMSGYKPAYLTFAGVLDTLATNRIFNSVSMATQKSYSEVHLMFQTTGGNVSEGVALFNFFRGCPIPIHLYNSGSVMSAGVIAFLGAEFRFASTYASFMIHKPYLGQITTANSRALKGFSDGLALDGERTTNILRSTLTLPPDRWAECEHHDVFFSASEAVESGIATCVKDFMPPKGMPIYNV